MARQFGIVTENRPNRSFSVALRNGEVIDCVVRNKVARDMFRILPGDAVVVEQYAAGKPKIIGFSTCTYFKRYWDENPGGLCSGWGGSNFFFEVQPDGHVARQIVWFDNGNVLLYDELIREDEYGGRSIVTLEFDEYDEFAIDRAEFLRHWQPSIAINRNTSGATHQRIDRSRD